MNNLHIRLLYKLFVWHAPSLFDHIHEILQEFWKSCHIWDIILANDPSNWSKIDSDESVGFKWPEKIFSVNS